MKYHIIAFGCQFNKADAEKISQLLDKKGHIQSPSAIEADLVVILACSVRQKSVDKIKNKISLLRSWKTSEGQGKNQKIILTGCILKDDKKQFEQIGVEIKNFKDLEKFPPITGLITIGKGCNNFCAYCVVPYTRGREKYRPQKEIIKEAKHLIKKGISEITLVGQNVNSYPNFVGLLQKITGLEGDFKVRFLTNHPKDFSNELVKEMAENPKLIKYVHLPFQAGDNEILRKMNRHYTRADYLKLIAKIKKAIAGVEITTDIIVGFPGETKKQFERTVEIMKKVGFNQAYIAKYSPRQGTAAFKMKDDVPAKEKAKREQVLRKLLAAQQKNQPGSNYDDRSILNQVKLIIILGPTASGKTDLAIKLARKFNAEIVCADSRQIYSEMAIGTAKPTKTQQKSIPHHLFGIIAPNQKFNAALYKKLAIKTIKDIQKRGKIPFLVGGTGLYIKAVAENIQFPELKPNQKLRKELEQKTAKELFSIYKKLDSKGAKLIDKNNKRRLVRAIEVCQMTGKPFWLQRKKGASLFDVLQIGINVPKKELEKRIGKRVEKMFQQGLEKEVKTLVKKYSFSIPVMQTIGYSEWQDLLNLTKSSPELDLVKFKKLIALRTLQFAKRQMTWFKKDKRIIWLKSQKQAENEIANFLKK